MPSVRAALTGAFEPNQGQTAASVRYTYRGTGYFVTLDRAGGARVAGADARDALSMRLIGAALSPRVTGVDILAAVSNYVIGADPYHWVEGVPHYAAVRYADVYPGIDLVYHTAGSALEYDFVVRPGATPRDIRLAFGASQRPSLDAAGDLVLRSSGTTLRQPPPHIYEESGGGRHTVAGGYAIDAAGHAGFSVGAREPGSTLVIDPTFAVSYSTFFGGSSEDDGTGVAVDGAGMVYVTGTTLSSDLPQPHSGAFHGPSASNCSETCGDVFIAKFDPTKSGTASLLYATYFGGSGGDRPTGIAWDPHSQRAYISGSTDSADLPTMGALPGAAAINAGRTPCAAEATPSDGFVAGFAASGALAYSTFLGGHCWDSAESISVDPDPTSDLLYLTGWTQSSDFPVTASAYQPNPVAVFGATCDRAYTFNECQDAFVSVIAMAPAGGTLRYSTYLAGNGLDAGIDIKAAGHGVLYVTGDTDPCANVPFPTTPGAFESPHSIVCSGSGQTAAFVTELDIDQSGAPSLAGSTLLAGASGSSDSGVGVALDPSGNVDVVASMFPDDDFAVGTGFLASPSDQDLLARLTPGLTAVTYASHLETSTLFGAGCQGSVAARVGSVLLSPDRCLGLAVDSAGRAYIAGWATGSAIPATSGGLRTAPASTGSVPDAFVEVVDPSRSGGASLLYATYLGGTGADAAEAVAVDPSLGNVYLTGATSSPDFPLHSAFQGTIAGPAHCPIPGQAGPCLDAFVTELTPAGVGGTPPPPAVSGISPNSGPTSGGTSVTVTGANLNGVTAVAFGGVAGLITADASTALVAVSPAHAPATVDVTVTTAGGTSTPNANDQYTFVAPQGIGSGGGGSNQTGGAANQPSQSSLNTGSGATSGLPPNPLPGGHGLPAGQPLPLGQGLPVGHGFPAGHGLPGGQGGALGQSLPVGSGGVASATHPVPGGARVPGGSSGAADGTAVAVPDVQLGAGAAPDTGGARYQMTAANGPGPLVAGLGAAGLAVFAGCLWRRQRAETRRLPAAAVFRSSVRNHLSRREEP